MVWLKGWGFDNNCCKPLFLLIRKYLKKQFVLLLAILFIMCSCLSDEDQRSANSRFMPVEQYITLLKSGNFSIWDVPIFEISDIPALLKYAHKEEIVAITTANPLSSAFTPPVNVSLGMVVLWTIEGTRLDIDRPADKLTVIDNPYRVVPQVEVTVLYKRWWNDNKDKTIVQLKEISPFDGTNLSWN